jgi:hypothetical protein
LTARIISARVSARDHRRRSAGCTRCRRLARSGRPPDAAGLRVAGRRRRVRVSPRPVSVNRLCVSLEWRIALSPSIPNKYSTSEPEGAFFTVESRVTYRRIARHNVIMTVSSRTTRGHHP